MSEEMEDVEVTLDLNDANRYVVPMSMVPNVVCSGTTWTIANAPDISPFAYENIRRIVAEEIEKALPRITSAVLEQMEQRVRLARGTYKEQAE